MIATCHRGPSARREVRRRAIRRSLLVLLLPCALPRPAAGQVEPGSAVPSVSLRETAAVLARSGAANADARTVLAAARVLLTAERPSAGIRRVDATVGPPPLPGEQAKADLLTAAGLLREASRIAVEQGDVGTARAAAALAGDSEVGLGDRALAEELQRRADALARSRGAAGGPIWQDGQLGTGEVAEYEVEFDGGFRPNRIRVSASSDRGDLDCYLYEGSNLVARDAGFAGDCSIEWSQSIQGAVILRIRNSGAGTYFVLVSN